MNKMLFVLRVILFHVVVLLFYLVTKITDFVGLREFIFVIFIFIYEFVLVKDIIQKKKINYNKKYNFFSILCFIAIIFILCRCLFDQHFIYNNPSFLKELNDNEMLLYGWSINEFQFSEIIGYYLINNVLYFNIMFILLFVYRKINLKSIK